MVTKFDDDTTISKGVSYEDIRMLQKDIDK